MHVASSLEEEEEKEMPLDRKKGLRELLANRAKGLGPKDASRSKLPPPPTPTPTINPFELANL